MVSRDSGASWRRLSTDGTRSVAFDPLNPKRVFAATDDGVRRWE